MKTKSLTFAIATVFAPIASGAALLGGFQGTNDTAIQSPAAAGVTVTLVASTGDITPGGGSFQSNPATWGTQALDVAPSDTGNRQIVQSGTVTPWSLTLTVTNDSAAGDVTLESIHYWTKKDTANSGPPSATFTYTSGDLGVTNSASLAIANGVTATDFALSTAGFLSDLTLAVGESATFTWTTDAPQNPTGNTGLRIDNFAISGEVVSSGPDVSPPTPDPMTWATPPAAVGDSSITMTATIATDPSGVEYYFEETTGNLGATDSGWQDSPSYTDEGLNSNTTYTYTVRARDKSASQFETASSAAESATTDEVDTEAPTPNPMTWASPPSATSDSVIIMTATTASDASGVEYSFEETTGSPGGTDSGWQDSPEYTDTGLSPETAYSYRVTARDKSAGQFTTASSLVASATTSPTPTGPILLGGFDGSNAVDAPKQHPSAVGNIDMELEVTTSFNGFNSGTMQSASLLWGTINLDPNAEGIDRTPVFVSGEPTELLFTITNTSEDRDLTLETFHWISKRDTNDSPNTVTISYLSGSLAEDLGTHDDYFFGAGGTTGHDYAMSDLLTDRVLAPGETATFSWVTSGENAAGNDAIRIDNIALSGSFSASDYFSWSSQQSWTVGSTGTNGNDDFDDDGVSNEAERIFGLDPTDASSSSPFVAPLDPVTGTFSYTRRTQSITGLSFPVWYSTDLEEWFRDINAIETSGVPVDDLETVGVQINPVLLSQPRLFFQLRPEPPLILPAPELINVSGSINTITVNFTEELYQLTATDPASYAVALNGGSSVNVIDVILSSNKKTVTLTLDSTLSLASAYDVSFSNLTGVTGVALAGSATAQFETWDNDPEGIKVFILAGQSNMVGYGHSEIGNSDVDGGPGSLRYLANNDGVYPDYEYVSLLETPGDPVNSAWATRSDVKVWWRDGRNGNLGGNIRKGDLGPPFQGGIGDWFGPELAFGQILGDYYVSDDVLIIKTAWGGRDLAEKFRSPRAVTNRGGVVGEFYTAMLENSREVLDHLGTEFPEWSGRGYQIVGFAWHQGYNDRVTPLFSAEYQDNLPDFIQSVRAEFGKPDLPFVIASTGMGGLDPNALIDDYTEVEKAQLWAAGIARPAEVLSTDTRSFWEDASVSPRDQGFHWNGNARSYFRVGKALGDDMVDLLGP